MKIEIGFYVDCLVCDLCLTKDDSQFRYLDIAVSTGIPCRCFWFDVSIQQCRHNERVGTL